ncbi:DUF1028 domain-containing protein [Denitrobaculum tricleocarpae]|uniref:DUF1028 domain-containing protein n=1 Tax=Denitrobaculum tricleocarpae TaxID=2591009 RepID=A0A545STB5_9PROT|nr:DUF1028 domain-containing protein [Denitrobaculum tricleocarpae]TQV68206.1 DUF1028 domain-containing protein [Denitrobaculum tricleocarpae]
MTFSIAARCEKTGMFGLAVSSSSPAVAARCAYARAGVGAVASQNITDPTLGPKALDLMAQGVSAPDAVARLVAETPYIQYRQLTVIDAAGRTGHFSGSETLGTHAVAEGRNVVCAGNLLANTEVPQAMVAAFEGSDGDLGDRLIAAMQAALTAGGEAGPVHSAGLYLVRDVSWPVADLRVDWDEEDPITALAALWVLYKPQLEAYVTRALDPREAPSYGVPGDK